ncbi:MULTISPECIES: flagellar filament capping protein FliD [Burkholderia]|uniref:flagellar filament capping protein FliD n=1 Tax=Burkholderia TaxID=32008 RepID=UPI000980D738|nr:MULTISPECIES: flagellar filament capping protein FliD [Burkholderia]AQQ40835.1 flagellar hook protein FliD [Burkholderia cenocepacia]MBG0875268.1 flagellar filament capping protein FliD [Burkholderia sp. 9775_39]MBG0882226.1 flagellar filament capping protein FliD [Burkholderia sp. 9773_38]ONV27161.1 flagellar hook protein FliD [Burkholderia cenocepacia]ONV31739.1 flagellar hook protein FliD [Burkholderia cenocepacia]
MPTNTPVNSSANANSLMQQAAQSIINGSTGNPAMDVGALVKTLVNAKTAGRVATLAASQASGNTRISAFGALSSALGALEAGLTSLKNGALQSTFNAVASGKGLTATAGAGAVAGTYTVGVTQIATAQALSSAGFNGSKALGTGTLTLSLGSQSFKVEVGSTNNTLAGIAAAINGASGNPGISATVINGTDGAHLVLASSKTGSANAISVAVANVANDSGLSNLGVTSTADPSGGASKIDSANGAAAWRQSAVAQDAKFTLNGIASTSASNTVSGVLTGITLNLSAAAVSATDTQTLTVSTDTKSQAATITNFVSLYNTVVKTMGALSSYTAGASSQGALIGDSTLNTIRNALASIVARGVDGGATEKGNGHVNLLSIGIKLERDGTLNVDSAKLDSALSANPSGVARLFNPENGIGTRLADQITQFTKKNGMIDVRTTALNADLKRVAQQQSDLSDYAAQLTKQYQAQFTALNTLMTRMNTNSQYLTRLFGGANSNGTLSKR